MNVSDEKYFGDLNVMFASDGWKAFKQEIEGALSDVQTIDGVNTLEDLYLRKGQQLVLNNIVSFEDRIAALQADNDESSS